MDLYGSTTGWISWDDYVATTTSCVVSTIGITSSTSSTWMLLVT